MTTMEFINTTASSLNSSVVCQPHCPFGADKAFVSASFNCMHSVAGPMSTRINNKASSALIAQWGWW